MPTIHQLATHDLLAAFLQAADPARGRGLVAWLPERAIANLFDGYLRPDALAVICTGSGRVTLFVERDLGSETAGVVTAKVTRYRTVLGRRPDHPTNVGIVVDSARRVGSILRRLPESTTGSQPCVWIGIADKLLADPFGAPWIARNGERRATSDLPSEPAASGHLLGPHCLLDPEGLEAFQQPPADLAVLRPFLAASARQP